MWALRDVVAAAGHYSSATEASAFYTEVASEINAACDQHPRSAGQRSTQVPPWRNDYLTDTARASWDVFRTLITMDGAPVAVRPSVGDPRVLELFARVTNGPLAPTPSPRDPCAKRGMPDFPETPAAPGKRGTPEKPAARVARDIDPHAVSRMGIARTLAPLERIVATLGIPAALLALVAWTAIALRRRRLDPGLVTGLALAAAVGARVVLLGFLDATSIPSNNMLYLSPVAPIALALVPAVLFGIVALYRNRESR